MRWDSACRISNISDTTGTFHCPCTGHEPLLFFWLSCFRVFLLSCFCVFVFVCCCLLLFVD